MLTVNTNLVNLNRIMSIHLVYINLCIYLVQKSVQYTKFTHTHTQIYFGRFLLYEILHIYVLNEAVIYSF